MTPEPRYAEWRPLAGRQWNAGWIGLTGGIVAFGLSAQIFGRPISGGLTLGLMIGQVISLRIIDRRMRKMLDHAASGQFAATLMVKREVAYGHDEGLISFVDGWLVFTGRRCTFSFPASVLRKIRISDDELHFHFGAANDDRVGHLKLVRNQAFREQVEAWYGTNEIGGDSIVLPPLVTDMPKIPAHRNFVILSFGTSISALFLTMFIGGSPFLHFLCLFAVAGFLGLSFYNLERLRILRNLSVPLPPPLAFWARPLGRPSLPADPTLQ